MPPPAPLQKQLLDIPLVKALDQSVYSSILPPGGLLRADNVCVDRRGAFNKRPGFSALSSSLVGPGTFPPIQKLCTMGNELLAIGTMSVNDGNLPEVFSWAPTMDKWSRRDEVCACSITREVATRSAITQYNPFVTYAGGLLFYWWKIGTVGIFLRIVDAATGAVVQDDTQMQSATQAAISCFTVGAYSVCVFCTNLTTQPLRSIVVDSSTLVSSFHTLDGSATHVFDAAPIDGDPSNCVVTWVEEANLDVINTVIFSVPSFSAVSTTIYTDTRMVTVSVCVGGVSSGKIYVGYYRSDSVIGPPAVYAIVYNDGTLGSGTAPVNLLAPSGAPHTLAVAVTSTGEGQYLIDAAPTSAIPAAVTRQAVTTGGALTGITGTMPAAYLVSRAFIASNGRMYCLVATQQNQSTVCLMRTDEQDNLGLRLSGVVARQEASFADPNGYFPPPFIVATSETQAVTVVPIITSLVVGSALIAHSATGTDLVTLDFSAPQASLWGAAEAQSCLSLTGGLTTTFDGEAVTEVGFVRAPFINGHSSSNTGGGGIAPGSYLYVATYEWVDSRGNIHQSAVSESAQVTVGVGENTVTIGIGCIAQTARAQIGDGDQKQIRIYVYRTRAGVSSPFYRLNDRLEIPSTSTYLANDPAAFSVSYIDTKSDSDLTSGFLYTDGGILENQCAPPSSAIAVHKNRMWLASTTDSRRLYFSKTFVPTEAPGFNEILTLRLDDSPDNITALASLDSSLIVFTRSRIYAVSGDGPDDTGANGSFTTPQLIAANAGCVDPRSVVSFSGGVFFQSAEGLSLLARDTSVTYAGANVLQAVGATPTFRATVHDTANRRIQWLVTPNGGAAYFIVYDYGWDLWTLWLPSSGSAFAATRWNGGLAFADHLSTPHVNVERYGATPGFDNGAWVTSRIGTPWIRLGAIGGFQRVWRLGLLLSQLSKCVVYVDVYVDYDDDGAVETHTLNLDTDTTIAGDPPRVQLHLQRQKCSAIRFVVRDAAPADPNSRNPTGVALVGLTLELGMKQGSAKLPATNKGLSA
jgi:hypothetical protein